MKILLSNKTEDGTEHIVKIGSESVIINEQNDLKIPVAYGELDILIDRLSELKSKIKPIRGQRRLMNLYEDSAGDFELPTYMGLFYPKDKENNIYLSQKERNVIRIQIEDVLHNFECKVDDCLRNNELQLAKVDHNVVDNCRNILNKLEIADYEDVNYCKYYLTIDISRQGDNNAILFQEYEGELKIAKFISFDEKDFTKIADRFIDEIKPFNGKIIIPNVCIGTVLIDYIKEKGFEDIIEIKTKELSESNAYNVEVFNNKNKLYKLMDNYSDKKYLKEFVELFRQLDNLQIKVGFGNIAFDKKDKDISNCWITNVFYTLSKLGYKL